MKTANKLVIVAIALLSGCASNDNYRHYIAAQKSIANSRTMAEIARYNALVEIAKQGDTTAKVAATMSVNQPVEAPQQILPPPKLFNWLP
jgi:hypothetical protein